MFAYLSASLNASTPNFDTEYGVMLGAARRPAVLDMLTMRPFDLSTSGRNVIVTSISPNKLTPH